MNYELAKELKDAGFPYQGKCQHCAGDARLACSNDIFPTLSELVEACLAPISGFSLEQHSNDWRAGYYTEPKMHRSGVTPEEAVAKLWLALNKK